MDILYMFFCRQGSTTNLTCVLTYDTSKEPFIAIRHFSLIWIIFNSLYTNMPLAIKTFAQKTHIIINSELRRNSHLVKYSKGFIFDDSQTTSSLTTTTTTLRAITCYLIQFVCILKKRIQIQRNNIEKQMMYCSIIPQFQNNNNCN